MKCPGCEEFINDGTPRCNGCGFDIADFDKELKTPTDRQGLVTDWAKTISTEMLEKIEKRLEDFSSLTGLDLCLVTLDSSKPRSPREFSFWLFNRWNIGGDNHAGALILLSMEERRIEVEVGHTVEKYISDEEAGGVLQFHAIPFFKKMDFDNGLFHSLDVLAKIFEHGVSEERKNEQ